MTFIFFRYVNVFTYGGETGGVQLDGIPLGEDGWVIIPGSNPIIVYKAVITLANTIIISHTDSAKVGVTVFGYRNNNCAYGFPAAFYLVPYDDVRII